MMTVHHPINPAALILSLMLALPALAQEKKITTVRFITFPLYVGKEVVQLGIGEGEVTDIELPTNALSRPYKMVNMNKCVLGKKTFDADGNPKFQIYGQTPDLTSDDQIILVTRKGAEPSAGLELTSFDGSERGFNGGKYLLMNAATAEIAGKLGETEFHIKPNQHTMIAPEPSKTKGERNYLYTVFFFRAGEITRPFYTSTWRFSDRARCMVFFHHDPHTRQLRTHTIRDYLN